jgi:hypothetical protein
MIYDLAGCAMNRVALYHLESLLWIAGWAPSTPPPTA